MHWRWGICLALALIGCERGEARRASRVVLNSSTYPPARSSTRTVDSTGWVDNGGRTSDQYGRSEQSGMRATETGSERPTGTPGTGLPLPIEPRRPVEVGEGAGAREPQVAGAPTDTAISRLARARCDHENACGRVGPKQRWPSGAACMEGGRASVQEDLTRLDCPAGIDNLQLAICLGAIRQARCDADLTRFDAIAPCSRAAICAPP